MKTKPIGQMRVLISGAGVAGLSLGFWLKKIGIEPVVIDRVAQFQAQGHYISLKGKGVEVVLEMGLEEACRAFEMRFDRLKMMNAHGGFLRMGSRAEFDQNLSGYILMLRSDLQKVLYEAVKDSFPIRYGTQIQAIRMSDDVEVDFSDGTTKSFDLVIGADGIHSRTRKLVFGEGCEFPLGGKYIGLTEDYRHGLDPALCLNYWGAGQMASLFPVSADRISAIFYYGADGKEPRSKDTSAIKEFLIDAYRDFAPEVGKLLSSINHQAFVFMDDIVQIRLPSVVKGRVVLVGDAAHCPTFLSGMGSSLALQGARLLAASIQSNASLDAALANYEAKVTPVAEGYRRSALQMAPLVLDRRKWRSAVRDLTLRLLPNWLMELRARRLVQASQ